MHACTQHAANESAATGDGMCMHGMAPRIYHGAPAADAAAAAADALPAEEAAEEAVPPLAAEAAAELPPPLLLAAAPAEDCISLRDISLALLAPTPAYKSRQKHSQSGSLSSIGWQVRTIRTYIRTQLQIAPVLIYISASPRCART